MNRRKREPAEENFRKWLIYTFREIRENFATIKQEQNAMQRRAFRKESDITIEHNGGRTKIDTGMYEGAKSSHCIGER